MTQTEKLYDNIADRNAAIYRLADEGKSHEQIAAALHISIQVVKNFLGNDEFGGA